MTRRADVEPRTGEKPTDEDERRTPLSGTGDAGRELADDARHGAIAAAHMTALCVVLDRAGTIVYANPAARRSMPVGCDSLSALLHRAEDVKRITACIARAGERDVEIPLNTALGASWHIVSVRPVDAGRDDVAAVLSAVDIDNRRAAEQEARHLAYHDRLTGLPNRVRFMRELEARLLCRDEENDAFGLLVVDLDRFKQINDSLGYEAGDAVLAEFANRLIHLAGSDALVSRLGGDEFAVVTAPAVDPEALARRVLDAMANPLHVAGNRLHVLPSIGVCRCPEHGKSIGDLMSHADVAMATAKRRRRGYCVFDAAMSRDIHARLILENDLVRAVKYRQFESYYQPRVSLPSGKVVGFEALVRWRHPERGLLPPAAFIDVAEETGPIVELGTQIMLEAMEQQRAWARAGYDVTISINVSARQLAGRELLAVVAENMARAGCDPTRIELEITESALIGDADDVASTLERITKLGVRIAIDDFGTGYSNLAYLRRYPLATLKIDRAFVADPDQAALLEAIIGMGQALDLGLVAEGVETLEQARWLAERGVDEAQGYLYARPMPVTEATAYLASEWPRPGLASAA